MMMMIGHVRPERVNKWSSSMRVIWWLWWWWWWLDTWDRNGSTSGPAPWELYDDYDDDDDWTRETGTGQQVAQLYESYMMIMMMMIGHVRPEQVNKWPNSIRDIWWWWWWWWWKCLAINATLVTTCDRTNISASDCEQFQNVTLRTVGLCKLCTSTALMHDEWIPSTTEHNLCSSSGHGQRTSNTCEPTEQALVDNRKVLVLPCLGSVRTNNSKPQTTSSM